MYIVERLHRKVGDHVALILPAGVELIAAFFGCLYVGECLQNGIEFGSCLQKWFRIWFFSMRYIQSMYTQTMYMYVYALRMCPVYQGVLIKGVLDKGFHCTLNLRYFFDHLYVSACLQKWFRIWFLHAYEHPCDRRKCDCRG